MNNTIDVKALADLPGFGKAAEIIRKKVDPDWGLSDADGKRQYTVIVEMERIEQDEEEFVVKAKSEKDAIKLAKEMFEDRCSGRGWYLERAYVEK